MTNIETCGVCISYNLNVNRISLENTNNRENVKCKSNIVQQIIKKKTLN